MFNILSSIQSTIHQNFIQRQGKTIDDVASGECQVTAAQEGPKAGVSCESLVGLPNAQRLVTQMSHLLVLNYILRKADEPGKNAGESSRVYI